MAERNGRMAMRYAISTISNNPNIARTAMKVGEVFGYEQCRHERNNRQDFLTNPIEHYFFLDTGSLVDRRIGRCDFCQGYRSLIYQE